MGNNYLNLVVKRVFNTSKTKKFEELTNERIDEIQNLSKQINFINLINYFNGENGPKDLVGFKRPLFL